MLYNPTVQRSIGNKKRALYKWLHELPAYILEQPTLLIGDFNTGQHLIDEEGATFYCEEQFNSLKELGWIDIWRSRNPGSREYSWFSNKGNGFRIDHAFASPSFDKKVENVEYSHNERISGISDHSMLILKLDCATHR